MEKDTHCLLTLLISVTVIEKKFCFSFVKLNLVFKRYDVVFITFFQGSAVYTDMSCHVTSIPVILGLHIRHIGTSSRPGSKRCALPTYLVYATISTHSLCGNQVEVLFTIEFRHQPRVFLLL